MAFRCGEYNTIPTDADSPEVRIVFTESKKFRYSSSCCLSKGFYEYYVDNTAKGKWKFDKNKSSVTCTASKAKASNWNTEDSAGEPEVTKLSEWSQTFSVADLMDEIKYSYSALPEKSSPPSTASPRSGKSAGSDKGMDMGADEMRRNTPEPPAAPNGQVAASGRRSRSKDKTASNPTGSPSKSRGSNKQKQAKQAAVPPSGPLPRGGRRPGSNGSDGGGGAPPGTPRSKKKREKLEAARVKDREMNGAPSSSPDQRAEMMPKKKGSKSGMKVGRPVPAARVNGGNGFGGLAASDGDDEDLQVLGLVSSEEKDYLTEQEQAFMVKKFLEHKIQKAQSRVDAAREEYNAAKAGLAKLKKSYRQTSIAKV